MYRIKQEEVIEVAGYDAATYMRIPDHGCAGMPLTKCFLMSLT